MAKEQTPGQETATIISLSDARDSRKTAVHLRVAANDQPQPALNLPPIVKALCLTLFAIFLVQQILPVTLSAMLVERLGFIPARYSSAAPFDLAAVWSPLTHALLHGGWLHITTNLGMFMAFGAGVEKTRGSRAMIFLLILSTLAGAAFHYLLNSSSFVPMIGASGGISGLFGVALVDMTAGRFSNMRSVLRALLPFAVLWIGTSIIFGAVGIPGDADQSIAWAAHVGGFCAGIGAALVKQR